tara:strand:- start:230 stop:553 length:324 start_codon:yes stop_codon:yes gene_type:complete
MSNLAKNGSMNTLFKSEISDEQYRKDKALISNSEFDQLENNLRRIAPKYERVNQQLVLPSLCKGREDEFLEKLSLDTRLIISHKIHGCAIAFQYENVIFKKAISTKG